MSVLRPLRALALLLVAAAAQAQSPAPEAEPPKALTEALAAAVTGPGEVKLDNQATLKVPAGRRFVPQPHAGNLLRLMGNPGEHRDVRGLVLPEAREGWFALISWEGGGYIKDDDAKDWNADDLLKSYREGTEAANEERIKLGGAAMEIVGWAEKPAYDASTHRLVWAMASKDKGAPATAEQGVNYNTFALGREGYLSLNLVTDLKDLPQHKAVAQELLGAIAFVDGKRYADFDSRTDKVAEYGLAALVLGVGAKKLGFFAVIAGFLAKFAKVFLIGGIALVGGIGKLLGRNKNTA
jgi:uncharacterized membrane-anchored protein